MKIMTVPTIILLEYLMFRKLPVRLAAMAAGVVCFGVAIATVTERVELRGVMPLAAAGSATVASAMVSGHITAHHITAHHSTSHHSTAQHIMAG